MGQTGAMVNRPTRQSLKLLVAASEPDNPRLDAWILRSTAPLDFLALVTIWVTVVPPGEIARLHPGNAWIFWTLRLSVSFVYALDLAWRLRLSHHRTRYLRHHLLSVVVIVMPVIRILFSVRLLRAMFQKGNLGHFLVVAFLLAANFTLIVLAFERASSDAERGDVGVAAWWACVTVATVGYGDYSPVTTGGRVFAVLLMGLGLVTLAVITAQISSNFMDQAARRRAAAEQGGDEVSEEPTESEQVAEFGRRLMARLDALEHLIVHREVAPPAPSNAPPSAADEASS